MNYYQSVDAAIRTVPATQPRKRKFNLVLGLKRCFNDFNEYLGIETTGDKIFYHTYLWVNMTVVIMCIHFKLQLMNM